MLVLQNPRGCKFPDTCKDMHTGTGNIAAPAEHEAQEEGAGSKAGDNVHRQPLPPPPQQLSQPSSEASSVPPSLQELVHFVSAV